MDTHGLRTAESTTPEQLRDDAFDEVVQAFFDKFVALERDFCLSLSLEESKALNPKNPKSTPAVAARYQRHYIAILLTLKGVLPSALIKSGESNEFIFERMVQTCLMPLFKEHKLAAYGFSLFQIEHATLFGKEEKFKGSWVFADTRSNDWGLVQDLFIPPDRKVSNKREEFAFMHFFRQSQGAPVTPYVREKESWLITYHDVTEQQILNENTDEELGCVIGIAYEINYGTPEIWRDYIRHFRDCYIALGSVGHVLALQHANRQNKIHPAFARFNERMAYYM